MDNIKKDLIDLFELDKLSPEKSAEMLERLSRIVFQAVLARVLPTLGEEDLAEYDKVIDGEGGGLAIFEFLVKKVPNLDEIIKEEAENLKGEVAKDMQNVGL